MKNILIGLMLLGISHPIHAQDSLAVYQRFPAIPPFSIMRLPDSTFYTKDDLKNDKPVIIMIFSPDCDHCQKAIKELLENYKIFKKAQIIMASPVGFNYIKIFYTEFKIANYPGIVMGRDGSHFFGYFFKIVNFPAIFVYDKKGLFVKSFEGSFPVKEIESLL